MLRKLGLWMGFAGLPMVLLAGECRAEGEYSLVNKEHRFEPQELTIPYGKKIKLIIDNQDVTPEEFESYELHRERMVLGGTKGSVFIGPLKPGRYPFFGELNKATAKGSIIAVPSAEGL